MAGFDLAAAVGSVSKLDTPGRLTLTYADIDEIHPDERNEQIYQLSDLDELVNGITLNGGLQQPLYVRPLASSGWGIISGHRRYAALRALVDGTARDTPPHPELRMIPVVYNRREGTEDLARVEPEQADSTDAEKLQALMEELRIIIGNSGNRKLTDAEISAQAARMEALYADLAGLGVRFPGRVRDQVAMACKVSAAKLGRLKVIRDKLEPGFAAQFQAEKLPEQTAYAIARMPAEMQDILSKACPKKPPSGAVAVQILNQGMDAYLVRNQYHCPDGTPCTNGHRILSHDAHAQGSWDVGRCGCCVKCDKNTSCTYACLAGKQAGEKKKAQAAKKEQEVKTEREQKEEATRKQIAAFAGRVRQAAGDEKRLIEAMDSAKAVCQGWYRSFLNEAAFHGTVTYSHPDYYFPRADVLAELCRALHVSADDLLGLPGKETTDEGAHL